MHVSKAQLCLSETITAKNECLYTQRKRLQAGLQQVKGHPVGKGQRRPPAERYTTQSDLQIDKYMVSSRFYRNHHKITCY